MAEVAQTTQEEFWIPPIARIEQTLPLADSIPAMAEACPRCSTEFLLGSRFCHSCGGRRPEAIATSTRADAAVIVNWWERGVRQAQSAVVGFSWNKIKLPSWGHDLPVHFQKVKDRVGLSNGSFIAFVSGLVCAALALLVGFFTVKTWNDFQEIQFYRAEWLLAATASFVAGILLKKPSRD